MNRPGRFFALAAALLFCCAALSAQTDRRDVRRGNRDFRKGDYREAEIDYRKALVKDSLSFAANYNLGNTLYRLEDMSQARRIYERLGGQAEGSEYASDYWYNAGNAAAAEKDWQAAVDAYRQSLLKNPGDLDAKENYIYAREMLKKQQEEQNQDGGGGQDENQDDDQDENQDGGGQDRNDNGDNDKDDGNRDQNDGGQDRQPGRQPQITPQAAQQMLQAIQAKEKETQEKVNKERAEAVKSRQKEKNW